MSTRRSMSGSLLLTDSTLVNDDLVSDSAEGIWVAGVGLRGGGGAGASNSINDSLPQNPVPSSSDPPPLLAPVGSIDASLLPDLCRLFEIAC